jgi:adenylate cyclase, class 2
MFFRLLESFFCMQEVEVKILEINREEILERLAKLNAKKVLDSDILTIFLDFPDNRIQKRKDVLRIRKEDNKVELTYKEVKIIESTKIAEEHTVKVSDLLTTQIILQKFGLEIKQKMSKHRARYQIEGTYFDIDQYIDEYSFIPNFLEIEGSVKSIKKFANLLGFQEKDCLAWSTDHLITHYAKKHCDS